MTKQSIELRFSEAIRLRDAGDLEGAAEAFEALAADYPDRAAFWGPLGAIYYEQERLEKAVAAFQRATQLSPSSELASISLFHALFDLGREDEAFKEMDRFVDRVPDSEEYRLLHSLNIRSSASRRLRLVAKKTTG